MNIPSQQKVIQRWDTLAPQLREAFFLESNDDFVEKLCQSEHLPQEKVDGVFAMASYALMGFMHPEDLADELTKTVGIPAPAAATIGSGINQRIFAPLRQYIDETFSPMSKFEVGPKIIQDINPSPSPIREGPATTSTVPMPPAPPAGWSRETSSSPVVRLSQQQPSAPKPASTMPAASTAPSAIPPRTPFVPPTAATTPAISSLDEFERLRLAKQPQGNSAPTAVMPARPAQTAPPAAPSPAPSVPSTPVPPPVMIHEDTQFKPQTPGFRFELPSKPIDMGARPGVPAPPAKAAVLEFGSMPAAAAPKQGPASTRVVHYKDYSAADEPQKPPQTPPTSPSAPTPPPPPHP